MLNKKDLIILVAEALEVKKNKQVPMRIASFMVAIDRVHTAYNLREG